MTGDSIGSHTSPPSMRDTAALPTPPSLSSKEDSSAHRRLSTGDSTAEGSSAHNESEAETEILSDDEQKDDKLQTKTVKKEKDTDGDSLDDTHAPGAINVRNHVVRKSSPPTEGNRKHLNGDVKQERGNGRRRHSVSISPERAPAARLSHPPDSASHRDPPSTRTSVSPGPDGSENRKLSPESRKRKAREDRSHRASEPPRQKHKASKSTTQPLPSPSTAHAVRQHKRSASTQSGLPPKRALREVSLTKFSTPDHDSDSDFTSDANNGSGNSPYPPPVSLGPSRTKRTTNKSLPSPVRAIPPKRKNPLDKYGASELSKACERGELEEVRQAYESHPELLDLADNAGVTPLAKAALNGHEEVVGYLLKKNCKVNCQTRAKETPLMDAVENGHLQVVRTLIAHGANPHHQNEDGQRAIDLIDLDCDDADAIRKELKKSMRNYAGDDTAEPSASQSGAAAPSSSRKDLFHVDPSRTNLRSYSAKGDALAVSEILVSIKPDLSCVVAAARGGHETVLSLLLASAPDDFKRDPDPAKHEETPILAALGRGHFGVLKLLLEQDNFNPTRRTRDGKTYWQVAQEIRGPKWEKEVELLKDHYEAYRAKHPGKGMKKRTSAPGAIQVSKKSKPKDSPVPKREGSASPRVPAKPASPGEKQSAKAVEDPAKPKGRFVMKREISTTREQGQRKRRIVVDEDSDDEPDTEVVHSAPKEHTGKKLTEDKVKAIASKIRRKSISSNGKAETTEKKKSSKLNHDKPVPSPKGNEMIKSQRTPAESAPPTPVSEAPPPPPPPPPRETTPEELKEARRAEAERLAREAEEKRLQAEREAREKRLAALPPTIKRACELGSKRPLYRSNRELGVTELHLPLHVVTLEADPFDPSASKEDRWCLSFQAVGLLGLPEPDLSQTTNWSGQTRTVTTEQRSRFRAGYNLQRLAEDFIFPLPGEDSWDADKGKQEAEASKDAEEKFKTMPLVWVKLEDIIQEAKRTEWLQDVEIIVWERKLGDKPKKTPCGSLRDKFRKDVKKFSNSPPATTTDVEMVGG